MPISARPAGDPPGGGLSLEEFAADYPFTLDDFQRRAILALSADRSVLVAAPTGTGKTVVAEYAIERALRAGRRAFYTAPIKALSNQKFRDLRARYGGLVGLMTGDAVENPAGRLLVMTTEVLRNMLLQDPEATADAGCIVFDEIHFIADFERGTTWEEIILLCPRDLPLVCLSATVPNAYELADWIRAVHGEIDLIVHEERAVPLEHDYLVNGQLYPIIGPSGERLADFGGLGGELQRERRSATGGGRNGRHGPRQNPAANERERARALAMIPSPPEVVLALRRRDLLPAIYFVFSRRAAEEAALECWDMHLLKRGMRARVERAIEERLAGLAESDRRLGQVESLTALLRRGIAFHHAGLLPVLKTLVEELFTAGLIAVVFATETLALGINVPARSVVISDMTKYDGETRRPLTPNEYRQLTGRAGRRGLDERGVAVMLYSPFVSFEQAVEIASGEMVPLESAFRLGYNTFANLWHSPQDEERIADLAARSLRSFQIDEHLRGLADELRDRRLEADDTLNRCYLGRPELLDEWIAMRNERQRLDRSLDDERGQLESLEKQADAAWRTPRSQIRAALAGFGGGELIHATAHGWGVYLRPWRGGIGLFLFGRRVAPLMSWGELDLLPPPARVALPEAIAGLAEPVEDASALVSAEEWEQLQRSLRWTPLPDVEALAKQAREWQGPAADAKRLELRQAIRAGEAALQTADAAIQEWPCAPCASRKECERLRRNERRLQREIVELEEEMVAVERARREEARRQLRAMARLLERFGYLERGRPTAKLARLRDLFDTNNLTICEALARGLWRGLDAADIVEVLSWFAFDRDNARCRPLTLPYRLERVRLQTVQLQQEIARAETAEGIGHVGWIYPDFQGVARAWAGGTTFAELVEDSGLSEGDLMQALQKTADLARQLVSLLRAHSPDSRLLPEVEEAVRLVRRGIVAHSLALPLQPALDLKDAS